MATTLFMAFEVNDFETWKEAFDAQATPRQQAGMITKNVFRSVANHNIIALTMEVPTVEAAKAYFEDPKLHAKMAEAGVISEVQMRTMGEL